MYLFGVSRDTLVKWFLKQESNQFIALRNYIIKVPSIVLVDMYLCYFLGI